MNTTNDNGFKTFAILILIIIIWLVSGSVREYAIRDAVIVPSRDELTYFVNYPYEDINDAVSPSIRAWAKSYDISVMELRNMLIPECVNGLTLKACATMD